MTKQLQTFDNIRKSYKTIIDVLAEIDDWYVKEITSGNPWAIPEQASNVEQKVRIGKLSVLFGVQVGIVITLVTIPILYGIWHNIFHPIPDLGEIGKYIGSAITIWPLPAYLIATLSKINKIRGNVTTKLVRKLCLYSGIGYISSIYILTIILNSQEFNDYINSWPPGIFDPILSYIETIQASQQWAIIASSQAIIPPIVMGIQKIKVHNKWRRIMGLLEEVVES